jgi:hypothetical protein
VGNKVLKESFHVDQVLILRKDFVSDFIWLNISLLSICVAAVEEVSVEFVENAHFAQVELVVKIVVQSAAELFNLPAGHVNIVPGAVVYQVTHTFKLIVLQTAAEVKFKVSWIDG